MYFKTTIEADVIQPYPPVHNEGHHFITLDAANEYANEWVKYKKNLERLLEWATNISSFNNIDVKEIREICTELNQCILIKSEKFELKTNPSFRANLLKMIQDSDTLDVVFGIKPIDDKLRALAIKCNSTEFECKKTISCISITGTKTPEKD